MDADEYAKEKKRIEQCPPAKLDELINGMDQERIKAQEKGDTDRATNFKELMRFAFKR